MSIDPEEYLTEESLSQISPSNDIEPRLSGNIGKHQYECCLIQTYHLTNKFLNNHSEIDESKATRHLHKLKAEILRQCIPNKIEWKNLLSKQLGYLIVKPQVHRDIFYRYLAYNLFISNVRSIPRFLDFHYFNTVQIPNSKSISVKDMKFEFIKRLDFTVIELIDNEMPVCRTEVSNAVFEWVSNHLEKMTVTDQAKYFEFRFDPERKLGTYSGEITLFKPLYAGCDDETLVAYFSLLLNTSDVDGVPFMDKASLDYLLWSWFRYGSQTTPTEGTIIVSLDQMIFLLRAFIANFQKDNDKTRKKMSQRNLVDLLYHTFPTLFSDVTSETVYKKFNVYAEHGRHTNLDWKKSKQFQEFLKRKRGDT